MPVKINKSDLDVAVRILSGIKNGVEIAAKNAINRAVTAGKTEAGRQATKDYTITRTEVSKTIITKKATVNNPESTIISRGKKIPLSKFKHTPGARSIGKRKILKVNQKRETGFLPIKDAFLARVKGGKLGIFKRAGKARLPIFELFGLSVPEMLASKSVVDTVEARAQDVLSNRFEHEVSRILERHNR